MWSSGTSHVVLVVKKLFVNAGDIRDVDLIPWSGRFPREGHGNPLQYSCLKNPMDRGSWQATVHRVAKWCRKESATTEQLNWTEMNWSNLACTHMVLETASMEVEEYVLLLPALRKFFFYSLRSDWVSFTAPILYQLYLQS